MVAILLVLKLLFFSMTFRNMVGLRYIYDCKFIWSRVRICLSDVMPFWWKPVFGTLDDGNET